MVTVVLGLVTVSASKPRIRPKLRRLYTDCWEGTCPKCGKKNTASTARCVIDGSPLVVSFDAFWWNPFTFPVESAEMRCLANCGAFSSHQVICYTGCGGVIAGRNLRFKFSVLRTLLYHGSRLALFAALCCVAIPAVKLVVLNLLYLRLTTSHIALGVAWLLTVRLVQKHFLPRYRWLLPRHFRTFSFEDVEQMKR
jgi:hypothetical protein